MVKRVLLVVGVIFLHLFIMFLATIMFQLLGERLFPFIKEQIIEYSGIFGTVAAALFAVFFSRAKGISKDMDVRKERRVSEMIAAAVLSVCIVPIVADSLVGILFNSVLPIEDDLLRNKTLFDYIDAILIAPFAEEYLFRKGLYGYAREKINIPTAGILTSLIFAVLHGYNLQGFLSTFFCGIILALIYERSGDIMYSICAHVMMNAFVNIVNALKRHGVLLFYSLNGYDIFTLPVILTAVLLIMIILAKGKIKIGKRKIQSTCS